jgi:hypothetical protein
MAMKEEPRIVFAGQRVRVLADSDGAAGGSGVIRVVYPSGRCLVDLDCGGFRNLSAEVLTSEVSDRQVAE